MSGDWIRDKQEKAAARVSALLAKPPIDPDGAYSSGERFEPWDLFPALYGSYSGAFDAMALRVLRHIRDGEADGEDLACEMLREMLCRADLCDYGTSPRVCFPTQPFRALLDRLIERWEEYAHIHWGEFEDA